MIRRTTSALALIALCLEAASAAAAVVEYRVTFEATWSAATHPSAYPAGGHFSPLVGGTHNGSVSFWNLGALASDAIEQMAEEGADAPLAAEVSAAISAGDAFSGISGGGPNSPGTVQTTFFVDDAFPLVTLVTMIAPSPDWFVGVSGLSLHSGTAWIETLVVELDPYDAGTDSGADFNSANQDTVPADPIAILGAPFTGTPALGTFTFERLPSECEDAIDNDGDTFVDVGSDPGCADANDDSERSPSLICDDGIDNDGDTLNDFPGDPGCSSPTDSDERSPGLICDDGIDNDGDSLIDFPQDPGCTGPLDPTEELDVPAAGAVGRLLLIGSLIGSAVWLARRTQSGPSLRGLR